MITEVENGKKVDKCEVTELDFIEFTELLDQYEADYIPHKFLLDKHRENWRSVEKSNLDCKEVLVLHTDYAECCPDFSISESQDAFFYKGVTVIFY